MVYTTEAIRNIALIGHSGSGKTTLTETLLLKAGRITNAGSVDKGNTVCDYDPLEKTHQHSLETGIVNLDYKDIHINILDTPGFPEFIGHSIAALSAVETAAVVINAQTGIETVTPTRRRDSCASCCVTSERAGHDRGVHCSHSGALCVHPFTRQAAQGHRR
jgi:elongation factor G